MMCLWPPFHGWDRHHFCLLKPTVACRLPLFMLPTCFTTLAAHAYALLACLSLLSFSPSLHSNCHLNAT